MKAVRVHTFGGPEVLGYEDVPRPEPAADELLVRVHAAGVNVLDRLLREGGFEEFDDVVLPWIPGWDLSGIVEAAGQGVARFRRGDAVFGMVRLPDPGNAYAEYAAVPATHVVPKPDWLDHTHAAGLPMAGLTAWRALIGEARLEPGQRVLVHAASGGVGHLAVQLAKARGRRWWELRRAPTGSTSCRSTPTSSSTTVSSVSRSVSTRCMWCSTPIGGEVQRRSLDVVAPGGVLVTLPAPVSAEVQAAAERRGIATRYSSVEPNPAALVEMTRLLEDGRIWPTISSVRPLAAARAAHEEMQAGHARGKVVLDTT